MADCNVVIPDVLKEAGTIDVIKKYKDLMEATTTDSSLYHKAKETIAVLFNDLQITEEKKALITAEHIANMSINATNKAMETALAWSKDERDASYILAKVLKETEVAAATIEKTKAEICLLESQKDYQCAQTLVVTAASLRENGTITSRDGCEVTGLSNNGLKYSQLEQYEANTYQILSDSFRKSGAVTVAKQADGSYVFTGGTSPVVDGYTNQQTLNAERQRYSYEESAYAHAANSLSVTVGQMLSADTAPSQDLLDNYASATNKLLTPKIV